MMVTISNQIQPQYSTTLNRVRTLGEQEQQQKKKHPRQIHFSKIDLYARVPMCVCV